MNFSTDTKLTAVARLARHLALAILLAAPVSSHAIPHTPRRPATIEPIQTSSEARQIGRTRSARTYLAMVGPSALTFAEAASPLPPEPVMPEPPKPKADPLKTTPSNDASSPAASPDATAVKSETDVPADAQPAHHGPTPISILPDDTRREIRAEDVLPYFQFPGSSDNGAPAPTVIINPAPAAAPPSTATYRQQ